MTLLIKLNMDEMMKDKKPLRKTIAISLFFTLYME